MVAQARSLGVETIVVRAGRLRQLRRYFRTVNIIARTARTADVVLSWMPKAHLYGGPGALAARKPTIWFQLSVPSRLNWMDRLATFIPARGILTLSVAADDAQRQLWPARRTRMVYPSVDLERFRARDAAECAQARQVLGLEESWPVLGIVARLQRWKGIHLAIEALPELRQTFPDVHLLVVGGTHFSEFLYEEELRLCAERLGVASSVRFVGLQQDIPLWISAMDVVVHASYGEPFGISIIEAMAMGKPVVASDSGGPLEIIDDGVNGVFFRTGDPKSLGDRVAEVLSDRELAYQLGLNARERAKAFSSTRFASEVGQAVAWLSEDRGRQARE